MKKTLLCEFLLELNIKHESKFNETSVNYEAESGDNSSYDNEADDIQCATQ